MVEYTEPRYTRVGDIELAYATIGSGERTIVSALGLGLPLDSLLDAAREPGRAPRGTHIFGRLGDFAHVVIFDRRGQGLSTRSFGFGTAEDRMDDIRAVMDANAIERTVVFGDHDGVCLALLFAATYPDRVSGLILVSVSGPRCRLAPDYPIGLPDEFLNNYVDWIEQTWGTGRVLAGYLGETTPAELQQCARDERALCTPAIAREHFRRATDMDVRDALAAVQAPALIIHAVDELMPISWARYLAEHLSDAALIEVPGNRTFVNHETIGPLTDAIEEFVTGQRPRPVVPVDRVLATVLFVDIVTSTERLVEMGDQRWSELVVEFRRRVREELEHYRGREVNYRGDDVLATFDGSTRAVRCAQAIALVADDLGVEVRAGLHTGELELQGDDVAGIAVNVGARVCTIAEAGEVLVTATLRDLVEGSGLEFKARGAHALKGIPGTHELFAVV